MGFEFRITKDNTNEVLAAMSQNISRALEACGQQAEGYAKLNCPVDTGYLRNSITHALAGGSTSISSYQNDGYSRRTGQPVASKTGSYSGSVGNGDENAVYIGSNASYAAYTEYGTQRHAPQPFLKPAVADHVEEYKRIIETYLKS